MLEELLRHASTRNSLRGALVRRLIRRLAFIPYPLRLSVDAVERAHYGYCVFHAARQAKFLGLKQISVLEFGVAGGNGLINLEYHATETKKHLNVDVQIYGFDSGKGLPDPVDYRDLPYFWREGFYEMDQAKLLARLQFAKVVVGRISDTLPTFFKEYNPASVAAIFIDLDYYSSTMEAFKIFEIYRENILPRVYVYLDDIIGPEDALYSSFTGERLAILEFNDKHRDQKISEAFYLRYGSNNYGTWRNKIYVYHDFAHRDYCRFIGSSDVRPGSLAIR
jgi:hypothetical protein